MSKAPPEASAFRFFTEVGILSQLSGAMLQSVLPDGVHPSHFGIVNHLTVRGEGKTPVAIASAMQVTKATMTHSLRVLEDRGFIVTRPSPTDGRAKCVYLTQAGHQFREEAIMAVMSRFGDLFTAEDLEMMADALPALEALRKKLDEARNP